MTATARFLSSASRAPRRLALWLVLGSLAFAVGCGTGSTANEKPTPDEIRQLRASVDAENAAPTAALPAAPIYRPWGVRETTVDALGRIGEVAVPALIKALAEPDPRVREQAARALARIGPAAVSAVPTLIPLLDDPAEEVRQAAARALGQIGPAASDAVPALVGLLESSDGKAPAKMVAPPTTAPATIRP